MTESTTEPSSGGDAEEARKRAVENLTYLRALYADVLRWYGVADSKAQVILTLNGVIIAFSSSSLLSGKEATWAGWARVFPWAAALCLASALYFAIDALHSNLHEANIRATTPASRLTGGTRRTSTTVGGSDTWPRRRGLLARRVPRRFVTL